MLVSLDPIRIILVEPAGALNVGAIARVMKNFGLSNLVLVNPHCDPTGIEAQQMAVHAKEVLAQASQVATLPEALVGCQWAIATTARPRALGPQLESPKTVLSELIKPGQTLQTGLIFGPEDRGLSNEELKYAQRFICIPSNPTYASLNLAQAVAICAYELYQLVQVEPANSETVASPPQAELSTLATLDELERYHQQLEAVLLKIGYLYPHTAESRMEKFRHLYNRSRLSKVEVAMLRGVLSQMEWALQVNTCEKLNDSTKNLEEPLS
ncbi:MAG: RNA methyltransferase [Scytolyngbya sp. HA4215-MV1]|jgi:tRNA/rRNA methyltransferase|nr:RNA methyltransferase [Scytolyngbya sp. HA4215-MV1]